MPTLTCEPRDAGAVDDLSVADLFEGDDRERYRLDACAWNCAWTLTVSFNAFTYKS